MIKVFHNSNFLEDGFSGKVTGELKYVANVNTNNLEVAFELTNHIHSDWTKCKDIEVIGGGQYRSSSLGDVFEKDGERYFVDIIGFKKIK